MFLVETSLISKLETLSLCGTDKDLDQLTNALGNSREQFNITALEKESDFLLVLEPNVANDTVNCHPSM